MPFTSRILLFLFRFNPARSICSAKEFPLNGSSPLSRAHSLKFLSSTLVLLCHKFILRMVCWQQGQRGRVRAMVRAIMTRTEVIEFAT
jgi:hypothetical protein